jgi:plastocyanin
MTRIKLLAALATTAATVAVIAVPASEAAPAAGTATTLNGVVGPAFNITLKKAGVKVTKLKHGTYVIKVADKSPIHNFRLKGPGVNKATTVAFVGSKTWTVTLKAGKYTIVCDPHAAVMKSTFTVT